MKFKESWMTGIKPVRRRCTQCKKRRVKDHHFLCNKCWKIRHLVA